MQYYEIECNGMNNCSKNQQGSAAGQNAQISVCFFVVEEAAPLYRPNEDKRLCAHIFTHGENMAMPHKDCAVLPEFKESRKRKL